MLDPRVIVWPEVRITSQYRDGEREALARSIEGVGQQQPIAVIQDGDQYIGVDGYNRCLRAIETGEALVLCVVRRGTAADALDGNIATAMLRGHTNPLSVVETFRAAYEAGREIADLAMSSGYTVDWVEATLLIGTTSPAVQQMLGEELITRGHAEALAELEDHARQEEALALVVQHRWTVAELEAHLAGKTPGQDDGGGGEPAREAKAARIPRACTVCHEMQEVGGVQSMLVCPGCMEGIRSYSQAGVGRSANEDARVAVAVRSMAGALREAEAALASSPGTVGLAEQIARLVELAGAGEGSDG